MTLQGAYGRTYKTAKAVLADWNAEKDFQIADLFNGYGQYIGINELHGPAYVRFDNDRKVCSVRGKAAQ